MDEEAQYLLSARTMETNPHCQYRLDVPLNTVRAWKKRAPFLSSETTYDVKTRPVKLLWKFLV